MTRIPATPYYSVGLTAAERKIHRLPDLPSFSFTYVARRRRRAELPPRRNGSASSSAKASSPLCRDPRSLRPLGWQGGGGEAQGPFSLKILVLKWRPTRLITLDEEDESSDEGERGSEKEEEREGEGGKRMTIRRRRKRRRGRSVRSSGITNTAGASPEGEREGRDGEIRRVDLTRNRQPLPSPGVTAAAYFRGDLR